MRIAEFKLCDTPATATHVNYRAANGACYQAAVSGDEWTLKDKEGNSYTFHSFKALYLTIRTLIA